MALPVIIPDDFSGWSNIVANSFKEDKLQEYIDLFMEQYLRAIVGDAAYSDMSTQTRQKWVDLLGGADYVNSEGKRKRHEGLTKSLIYFIYFEFVRDNFTATQTGKVKGKSENSERATALEVANIARSRFNQGALLVRGSTPFFLEANQEFDQEITASTDNADNTYLLAIASTKYLEVGDSVNINGQDYVVSAVVVDTSIVIDAGQTGLDFAGISATWEPYEDVEYCEIGICGI